MLNWQLQQIKGIKTENHPLKGTKRQNLKKLGSLRRKSEREYEQDIKKHAKGYNNQILFYKRKNWNIIVESNSKKDKWEKPQESFGKGDKFI